MSESPIEINHELVKPFLKWVGGKTQIIEPIIKKFPKTIKNYYEPFIGGGSIFLELLRRVDAKEISVRGSIILNDKNTNLINLYKLVQNNVENLIEELETLSQHYFDAEMVKYPARYKYIIDMDDSMDFSNPIPSKSIKNIIVKGKSYIYYYYRNLYNTTTNILTKSALLIILNKTCFRGLYREGKNGFNVPFGNYENPSIFNKEQLLELSRLFNKYNIKFHNKDFEEICINVSIGDFIYFDPPYYPIKSSSFTAYKNDGFNTGHDRLFKLCHRLDKENIKFLQSNSWCEYNNKNYKKYKQTKILCKRRINSKKPNDSDYELLITNFSSKPIKIILVDDE